MGQERLVNKTWVAPMRRSVPGTPLTPEPPGLVPGTPEPQGQRQAIDQALGADADLQSQLLSLSNRLRQRRDSARPWSRA